MYLPESIDRAKVLITVKTYPFRSNKYEELVCTADVLEDGKWIRIYPIPFQSLPGNIPAEGNCGFYHRRG